MEPQGKSLRQMLAEALGGMDAAGAGMKNSVGNYFDNTGSAMHWALTGQPSGQYAPPYPSMRPSPWPSGFRPQNDLNGQPWPAGFNFGNY